MRKILEDFYFGNITPSVRIMTPNSKLRRMVNNVTRCENQLKEQLSEPEQALLTELVSSQQEIDRITECESFILGFRLGVKIIAACMDENDGDTQQLTDGS